MADPLDLDELNAWLADDARTDTSARGLVWRTTLRTLFQRLLVAQDERDALRAMLGTIADMDPLVEDDDDRSYSCRHCAGDPTDLHGEFAHAPDCPWVKARALVGKGGE